MSQGVDHYDAVLTVSEDRTLSGETLTSTGKDENAVLVDGGAQVTLEDVSIERTSDESTGGDSASFYGVGSALLVTEGTVTVTGSTITTDASGGAGVFALGEGTAQVSDSVITTAGNASGGIHVAGGGTLHAENLEVTTSGESSAAIRSDRGGGTMVVTGGSYTSKGTGSPAVYCTADIQVSDAVLSSEGSEAVCIEGFNSLKLSDVTLSGSMKDDPQNDCTWNVILYQSMSGDSQIGNSTFAMEGGQLTANGGGMFYTTNTESTFVLQDVDIKCSPDNDFFLKCTGNSNKRGWGTPGANGADCTFTAISQKMEGDVIWDSISSLSLTLQDGSTLTGSIIDDETHAGEGGDGTCTLTLSEDSTWIVEGDSTLTRLYGSGKILDSQGKTVTIQGVDGSILAEGDSQFTITTELYEPNEDNGI